MSTDAMLVTRGVRGICNGHLCWRDADITDVPGELRRGAADCPGPGLPTAQLVVRAVQWLIPTRMLVRRGPSVTVRLRVSMPVTLRLGLDLRGVASVVVVILLVCAWPLPAT
jgi:hypothetical protein